jgi:excisionase family DNA binding protein
MSVEAQRLLTVGEVADRLQMTPDGVYKLIQRGKLEAVKLSERKTRVPEDAFNRYYARLEAWADRYLAAIPRITAEQARTEFEAATGQTPEAWLTAWKRDELEDTPENMSLLIRVSAIRSAEAAAVA